MFTFWNKKISDEPYCYMKEAIVLIKE